MASSSSSMATALEHPILSPSCSPHHHTPGDGALFASPFPRMERFVPIAARANLKPWRCTGGSACSRKCAARMGLLTRQGFGKDRSFSNMKFGKVFCVNGSALDNGRFRCMGRDLNFCLGFGGFRVLISMSRNARKFRLQSAEDLCHVSEVGFVASIRNSHWSDKSLCQSQQVSSDERERQKTSSLSQSIIAITENEPNFPSDGMALAGISRSSLELLASSSGGFSSAESWDDTGNVGCAASMSVLKGTSHSPNGGLKMKLQDKACAEEERNSNNEVRVNQSRLQRLNLGAEDGNQMARGLAKVKDSMGEGRSLGLRTIQERLEKVRDAGRLGLIKGISYTVNPQRLVPGEYVVHKRVGVGRFVALKDEIPEGKKRPITYVYLKYADGMAKLPAKQAHRLLYRYNQAGETCKKAPALNKLHDTRVWESKKSMGRLAIQKLVVTMVEQTVRRLKQKRPCYAKDNDTAAEFAALFKYTPTQDQQQAFCDVEEDMTERESPMDRLICGDVGFGKTEIALRAIFIAVASGKQAMVLAPTTVLAKQHHEVISDRFSSYSDVKVALLTRFQKGTEKKKLIEAIHTGRLDIIIGTHGLLSDQVQYGKLGLLVVDEEQRFGVKQKEKIASLKATVDVLTLSATPIPRTLYMALNGFRDVSLLTTPPSQRLPIDTRISEYSDEVAKDAIKFELERGGQVFYVVPRIKDIEHKKASILSLFPNMKVLVAHGQQNMSLLESTMEIFSKGEGDILLCTSIVESGLDIPKVNTILIEDAHLFGLAQLYQLRGRVGRGEQEGHAYMFHPPLTFMGKEALQRLNALKECCGLGQGFQLAEKDMTIRGIGSVFSEKQSGDMSNLGVDLYAEMLFESLSNEEYLSLPQVEYDSVQLDMDLNTEIPSTYISSSEQRDLLIEGANQAARDGLKALMKFTTRLRAEFGSEPASVQRLLKTIYVKKMAADLGIHRVVARNGEPVLLETTMDAQAFAIISSAIGSDSLQNSLILRDGFIQLQGITVASMQHPVDYIFSCLTEMRNCLPSFIRFK
ncbi:hypothetical protein O6H91_08G006100 [Diphasiastrum complanatum]|nr:hypothetical protein O6H91_08G006100 [Diphasiastrum complanatum]